MDKEAKAQRGKLSPGPSPPQRQGRVQALTGPGPAALSMTPLSTPSCRHVAILRLAFRGCGNCADAFGGCENQAGQGRFSRQGHRRVSSEDGQQASGRLEGPASCRQLPRQSQLAFVGAERLALNSVHSACCYLEFCSHRAFVAHHSLSGASWAHRFIHESGPTIDLFY